VFPCTRFASLSVSSGSEAASSSPRMHHPLYGGGLASAMSHTYMNQYTGSEYNLDKVQVRKIHSLCQCSGKVRFHPVAGHMGPEGE